MSRGWGSPPRRELREPRIEPEVSNPQGMEGHKLGRNLFARMPLPANSHDGIVETASGLEYLAYFRVLEDRQNQLEAELRSLKAKSTSSGSNFNLASFDSAPTMVRALASQVATLIGQVKDIGLQLRALQEERSSDRERMQAVEGKLLSTRGRVRVVESGLESLMQKVRVTESPERVGTELKGQKAHSESAGFFPSLSNGMHKIEDGIHKIYDKALSLGDRDSNKFSSLEESGGKPTTERRKSRMRSDSPELVMKLLEKQSMASSTRSSRSSPNQDHKQRAASASPSNSFAGRSWMEDGSPTGTMQKVQNGFIDEVDQACSEEPKVTVKSPAMQETMAASSGFSWMDQHGDSPRLSTTKANYSEEHSERNTTLQKPEESSCVPRVCFCQCLGKACRQICCSDWRSSSHTRIKHPAL